MRLDSNTMIEQSDYLNSTVQEPEQEEEMEVDTEPAAVSKKRKRDNQAAVEAALTALTVMYAQLMPGLTITSLSPGFVDTNMTAGYGAKLSPEEGCKSTLKCLFGDVKSGCYYGSDGLRSPLTISRDPGTPEYQGEDNPNPTKYNV